ncbi:hypothetical protein MMC14_008119, partial [Varicellaria rhodocarpa]|nr:hypothetical protein [Varicellaria rhodocarpa]
MVALTKLIALIPFVALAFGAPVASNAVQQDSVSSSYKDMSKRIIGNTDEDLSQNYKRSTGDKDEKLSE